MVKRRSTAAARKRARPADRWGAYMVAVTLLLMGVTVAASQVLWAGVTPEPAAAPAVSTASPAANGEVVGNAPAGDNSAQTLNLYGGGMRPLVEERDGVQTLNIYGPGGRIIAQVVRDGQGSEEVRYLLTDHLGSTRVVVDADGNAVARYEYAPHGETTAAGTAAGEVRYRYTGHPYDEGQEVYQTSTRGYEPTLGRFLSVDPKREAASPYTYVTNNPVLYKDPNGKGRVGTVITGQVRTLAKKLVAKTSEFESSSTFLPSLKDPVVSDFFYKFDQLYDLDPMVFDYFTHRLMERGDANSLEATFFELDAAVPDLPRVTVVQRVKIMSYIKKFHRLFRRVIAFDEQRSEVLMEEFGDDEEKFYRSQRSLELLEDTSGSAPGERKGFGNCGDIASCIGGQIAAADPEVNVELFGAGRGIDHTFVVVGRDPSTDASKPMSWNKEAHIVDGWHGYFEPAKEIYTKGINTKYFNIDSQPEHLFTFD